MASSKKDTIINSDYTKSKAQLIGELAELRRQFSNQQVIALEHLNIEEALAREKEQLSVTLHSIGDGVITTDNEGRVMLFNEVAQKLTGWVRDEVEGCILEEVFHIVNEHTGIAIENPVKKVLETGLVRGLANNTILIARDGTTHVITDSAAPIHNPDTGQIIGVVFVFRDITTQKQLEQEVYKAQKLESIGVLAGGIAHDFNNILTTLTSNLWLARVELRTILTDSNASDSEASHRQREEAFIAIHELLAESETAALGAKELTGQLLTFARGGMPVKQATNIKALIEETVSFALRGSNVQAVLDLPQTLWWVEVDPGQLRQVITNLVINAQQAMPEGGILNVQARNIGAEVISQQTQLLAVPLKALDYISISIEDHGVGIVDRILPKIFDPYFSTKSKGSGLGLATSYSIVNRHEGLLSVTSQVGKGTTFIIYLPALKLSGTAKLPAGIFEDQGMPGQGKRLLIMDDERPIINVLKRILTKSGYEVDAVEEGESVIKLYQEALDEKRPFALVILDLTIVGGLGGIDTIARLSKIDPEVKAIVMSGYNDSGILNEYEVYGFAGKIAKPFKVMDLYHTIEEVLLSHTSKTN